VTAFAAITVAALVVWNLPGSKLRTELMRAAEPYATATGLDQNWSVFAPNPYRESFELAADITYADGSRSRWAVPVGSDGIGQYWDFRWGKWAEWTAHQANPDLCPATTTYVANRQVEAGLDPVQVDLVSRRRPNARPGAEPSHGDWEETVICTGRFDSDEAAG
jgi:hypothetical protein